MNRREFVAGGLMAAALPALRLSAAEKKPDRPAKPKLDVAAGPMKVLFTGTGAVDWSEQCDPAKERRACTGILIDDKVLVDFNANAMRLERVYNPPEGRPVWGTHLSMALNGSQQDCEREYPKGIVPAYDGLTVML